MAAPRRTIDVVGVGLKVRSSAPCTALRKDMRSTSCIARRPLIKQSVITSRGKGQSGGRWSSRPRCRNGAFAPIDRLSII